MATLVIISIDGYVGTVVLMKEAQFVCFDVAISIGDGKPRPNRLGYNIHITVCCIGVDGRLVAYS